MNIQYTQNIFKSSNEITNITYYILQPTNVKIKGILQISHGLRDYFIRYTSFATFMCQQGYIVCGHDHIGHGSSVTIGNGYGYFHRRRGDIHLIADMMKLTDIMKDRFGNELKYFVLGHDIGALMTQVYATEYGDKLSGILLLGTYKLSKFHHLLKRLVLSELKVKGPLHRSMSINNRIYGHFNRKFKNAKNGFEWLTRDADISKQCSTDEKCNFILTLSGYHDLANLTINAGSGATYKNTPSNLPVLILSGKHDPATHWGTHVDRMVRKYKSSGCINVYKKIYPNCRHELLNETCKKEIYNDILKWIDSM